MKKFSVKAVALAASFIASGAAFAANQNLDATTATPAVYASEIKVDATNGTACRRVNLTVGGPGCEAEGCRALVGCARAAVCVSTGGGESSAMAYMVAAASIILLRTTDGPGVATVGRRRAERGAPSSRYAYI